MRVLPTNILQRHCEWQEGRDLTIAVTHGHDVAAVLEDFFKTPCQHGGVIMAVSKVG